MPWLPFEVYKDYWGMYAYDLATGKISLAVVGGNYVPPLIWCRDCGFSKE